MTDSQIMIFILKFPYTINAHPGPLQTICLPKYPELTITSQENKSGIIVLKMYAK